MLRGYEALHLRMFHMPLLRADLVELIMLLVFRYELTVYSVVAEARSLVVATCAPVATYVQR